jgi:hypothetical protein
MILLLAFVTSIAVQSLSIDLVGLASNYQRRDLDVRTYT